MFDRYTISPLAEECEVDGMKDGTKVVWVMGSVAADEPEPDEDQDTSLNNVGVP